MTFYLYVGRCSYRIVYPDIREYYVLVDTDINQKVNLKTSFVFLYRRNDRSSGNRN